jgi:hypothetical protein
MHGQNIQRPCENANLHQKVISQIMVNPISTICSTDERRSARLKHQQLGMILKGEEDTLFTTKAMVPT